MTPPECMKKHVSTKCRRQMLERMAADYVGQGKYQLVGQLKQLRQAVCAQQGPDQPHVREL